MNKLTPDLYAEAFGILTRKLLKDDCLAMRNSILAKRPEKELITELFQPLLEMMEASESLTPNLSNPLYTQLTPPDEGNVLLFSFVISFTSTMISWSTASLLMISAGILKMITAQNGPLPSFILKKRLPIRYPVS